MERVRKRFPTERSHKHKNIPSLNRDFTEVVAPRASQVSKVKVNSLPLKHILNTSIIRNFGLNLFDKIIRFIRSDFLKSKKFQYFILPLLIIFILSGYAYYWYAYSFGSVFTVYIHYKYKNINETRTIPLADKSSAIQPVELTAEDTFSGFTNTTGEKPTGDKSKGPITIFNPTTEIKVLPAGTILTCISSMCNTLTYVTDNDLNVGPGGSEEVKVTAAEIGENYNIQPGNRFKVGAFDPSKEVLASNIKAILGGTPKKMIKIVNTNDIKKAEENAVSGVKSELLKKIETDTNNKNYVIADASAVVSQISSQPDKQDQDEAEVVNVSVKSKISVKAIKEDDIKEVITNLTNEVTPKGYYLDEEVTKTKSDIIDKGKGKIEVSVNLVSVARPKIDTKEIKKSLSGVSYTKSEEVLSHIPNIVSYTKTFEPQTLPQYFWKIPSNPDRIQIKLLAEEGQSK